LREIARAVDGTNAHNGQVSYLDLIAIIVPDYDDAIRFFVDILGFDLVADDPSKTNDGRPKRWVVVRPKGGMTGLLLAQADGKPQAEAIGSQFAERVGLFLRVEDFDQTYRRLKDQGVEFLSEPRSEVFGKVAVFKDLVGNKWDLLSQIEP
jgi:catechol 2,3-dioxygenase-like lactoylglutathione lyase family enzyme